MSDPNLQIRTADAEDADVIAALNRALAQGTGVHAQIAETLGEQYGDHVEAHAAELARHFAEAQAVMGSDKLVHYSLLAAKLALAANAPEEALAQFQRGLLARGVTIRRH